MTVNTNFYGLHYGLINGKLWEPPNIYFFKKILLKSFGNFKI